MPKTATKATTNTIIIRKTVDLGTTTEKIVKPKHISPKELNQLLMQGKMPYKKDEKHYADMIRRHEELKAYVNEYNNIHNKLKTSFDNVQQVTLDGVLVEGSETFRSGYVVQDSRPWSLKYTVS